jgi:single-strand DNA-binding protein
MKNIVVCGNIGKSAETRTTQGGDKVTSWSVAVEERTGKEKSTIWFDCSLWGKRGESLASYLTKGSKVAVSGDLGKREYEGKTYLTIRADQVTLMGSKPSRDDGGYSGDYGSSLGGNHDTGLPETKPRRDIEDIIPF